MNCAEEIVTVVNPRYSNRNPRRNFCVLFLPLHTQVRNLRQASLLSGRTLMALLHRTRTCTPRYRPPPCPSHLLSHRPSPTPLFTCHSAVVLASEIPPTFYFSGAPSPGAQMPHPTCQGPCFRTPLPRRLSAFHVFLVTSDTLHLAPTHPRHLPVSLGVRCANFSGPIPPSYTPRTAGPELRT